MSFFPLKEEFLNKEAPGSSYESTSLISKTFSSRRITAAGFCPASWLNSSDGKCSLNKPVEASHRQWCYSSPFMWLLLPTIRLFIGAPVPSKARTGWNWFSSFWDEPASGTARSNTENGLHSWSAPRFCMGQDFLWDSTLWLNQDLAYAAWH